MTQQNDGTTNNGTNGGNVMDSSETGFVVIARGLDGIIDEVCLDDGKPYTEEDAHRLAALWNETIGADQVHEVYALTARRAPGGAR